MSRYGRRYVVERRGQEYEIHMMGLARPRVYHRRWVQGSRRYHLVRVRSLAVRAAVLQELREQLAEQRRVRESARQHPVRQEPPQPEPPRPVDRMRWILGYPLRWLRAFWRATKIETEAGPITWCRRATLWARTD